jgi:hypothetical protein
MPVFEFELPQVDYDYIQGLSNELGVTPSEALHDVLAQSKGNLTDDDVAALAEATIAKGGKCVVPDEAYWAEIHRGIEEAGRGAKSGPGRVA